MKPNTSLRAPALQPLAGAETKLLLLPFRSGEAVQQHPELAPLLAQGWRLKSAVPRIVEGDGLRLFVVLTQPQTLPLPLTPAPPVGLAAVADASSTPQAIATA